MPPTAVGTGTPHAARAPAPACDRDGDTVARECAVHTEGLRKSYGSVEAVRGVDLRVPRGETFGFLGPNGAGKTTTISVLCTLARPTSGRAYVGGADVSTSPSAVRRAVGLVFQAPTLDEDLTARQNLRFHGELYGLARRRARYHADWVLELVGLSGRGHDLVRTFSGGMKRRLEIARGMMHTPQVLVLDEPTVGLDPQTRASIWESLHALRRDHGLTLFLTTHHLEEAEQCDRIAIIDQGVVVAEGSPAALKDVVGADRVELHTSDPQTAEGIHSQFGLPATQDGDLVRVHANDGASLVPRLCSFLGSAVRSVSVTRPTLDDVFLHYTGRTIRDTGASESEKLRHMARRVPNR